MTMAPRTFRKKPIEIQAMRAAADDATLRTLMSWMTENHYPFLIGNAAEPEELHYPDQAPGDHSRPDKGHYINPATGLLVVRTLEGDMTIALGDWVIRGVSGEFYPCKPDIFAATYDEEPSDG